MLLEYALFSLGASVLRCGAKEGRKKARPDFIFEDVFCVTTEVTTNTMVPRFGAQTFARRVLPGAYTIHVGGGQPDDPRAASPVLSAEATIPG